MKNTAFFSRSVVSLAAAAALGLAASGGALAQSSVTIYGTLDLGMASINSTSTANGATVASGDAFSLAGAQDQSTDSRLGFRGTEDLGGGLRAGFVYEIGINADRGDVGNAQTRLANLSLTGGFGTVVVGTFMNAFQTVRDFNTDVSLAPGGNFMEFHGGLDGRSENAIAYISPIMNGFTFSAGAVSEDNVTTAGANRTGQEARGMILGLGFEQGPLRAQLAFADLENTTWNNTATPDSHGDARNWALGLSYNFGFVVPSFQYETGEATSALAVGESGEFNAWQIGARFPMGALTPFVNFGDGEFEFRSPGLVVREDTRSWQIGTTYSLSSRTWIYAAVGEGRISGTDAGVSWRDREEGYSVGLVHTF